MERNDKFIRETIGGKLKEFRESLNLSVWKVSKKAGIGIEQVHSIEEGSANYTIDTFSRYLWACDLYMYFATKDEGKMPHDFDDLIKKSEINNPHKS